MERFSDKARQLLTKLRELQLLAKVREFAISAFAWLDGNRTYGWVIAGVSVVFAVVLRDLVFAPLEWPLLLVYGFAIAAILRDHFIKAFILGFGVIYFVARYGSLKDLKVLGIAVLIITVVVAGAIHWFKNRGKELAPEPVFVRCANSHWNADRTAKIRYSFLHGSKIHDDIKAWKKQGVDMNPYKCKDPSAPNCHGYHIGHAK